MNFRKKNFSNVFLVCVRRRYGVKRPRVRLFNLSGIGFRSTSKMAAQSHSHWNHQSSNVCRAFSIFWLVIEINLHLGKRCHRKNVTNINIFRHTLVCHYLWLGMFWWNFTTIRQFYIPYNFAQSGCIPPKLKCEILACKVLSTTRAMPGNYHA